MMAVKRARAAERAPFGKELVEAALPWVLRLVFIAYPLVTTVAFEAFSCYEFIEPKSEWLKVDVAIECGTWNELTCNEWSSKAMKILSNRYVQNETEKEKEKEMQKERQREKPNPNSFKHLFIKFEFSIGTRFEIHEN